MTTLRVRPAGNLLIASLAQHDRELLEQHLATVELKLRQRLETANRKISTVYFIERGLVSVIATGGRRRRQSEIAVVGPEGMTGVCVVLGADRSPYDAFMQTEGRGRAIAADTLRLLFSSRTSLARSLLLYTHIQSLQAGHTALANAHGRIEERLARWLLMAHDRLGGDELPVTHEFLSSMLGVRRAGVTLALHQLEAAGSITTARRCVTILDKDRLQKSANGLYGVPESEFERLFAVAQSQAD